MSDIASSLVEEAHARVTQAVYGDRWLETLRETCRAPDRQFCNAPPNDRFRAGRWRERRPVRPKQRQWAQ